MRVAYGREVARLHRVLAKVFEQHELAGQDHAGHGVEDAQVRRFYRARLIKRLGDAAAVGEPAGDGMSIVAGRHNDSRAGQRLMSLHL